MRRREHEGEVEDFLEGMVDGTGESTGILYFDDTCTKERYHKANRIVNNELINLSVKLFEISKEHKLDEVERELVVQLMMNRMHTMFNANKGFAKHFFGTDISGYEHEVTDVEPLVSNFDGIMPTISSEADVGDIH